MATIKSFTDLEQSRKLAKILPIESADMYYEKGSGIGGSDIVQFGNYADMRIAENMLGIKVIPCWSLAALLDALPKNLNIGRPSLESNYKGYYWIQYYDEFMKPNNYKTECFNNPVDACVAMIENLHELKML